MTTHRFYIAERLATQSSGQLQANQTHQARRVLRLRAGDEIIVFDGSGYEYLAKLQEPQRDSWPFLTGDAARPAREPEFRLTVGLALIRNERFGMAVQKLTELGVAGIAPLVTERGVISYDDARAWEKRRARLERIVIEAAEQSERTTLPELHAPLSISDFLNQHSEVPTIALVERTASTPIADVRPGRAAALMIGPEGGWSPAEIEALADAQVTMASLGALILRAETAAIAGAGYLLIAAASEGATTP